MDSDLCAWEYRRHHYLIVYHNPTEESYFYSQGTNVNEDGLDEELNKYRTSANIEEMPYPIEDDDSVLHLMYRMSLVSNHKREYLYFYTDAEPESNIAANMGFDLTYRVNKKTARKFKYTIEPNPESLFQETIENDTAWTTNVAKHDFTSSLLSSFEYETDILRVIHCYPIDTFIYNIDTERVRDLSFIKYHIRTYYPDVKFTDVENIVGNPDHLKLIPGQQEHMESIVSTSSQVLDMINNTVYNKMALRANGPPDDVTFGDGKGGGVCNILEAVIHVNYNETNDEFVDLNKIFLMERTSPSMPFSRYLAEDEAAPKYKIYSELTNEKSKYFTPKKIIQDWINPKLNKMVDKTDVYAMQKEQIKKIGGRGLSFKFLRPNAHEDDTSEQKYFTVNIYRNGRLDIKCHWDEQYGTEDSPGGTPELVHQAINHVREFVKRINKLQFDLPGSKKKKITLPAQDLNDPDNINTNVAFFNTITTFDFHDIIDRDLFMDYLKRYTTSHIVLVQRDTISGIDTRSFEFRYKRVHNYIHIKSIYRTIKQYIDKNKAPEGKYTEYKKDLIKFIASIYSFTEAHGRMMVNAYESLYGTDKNQNKGRGRKVGISGKQISEILDRSIEKKSGIDIKILKRYPKVTNLNDPRSTTYKCLILGIDRLLLGRVIHFLKYILLYYKHKDVLYTKDPIFAMEELPAEALDAEGEADERAQMNAADGIVTEAKAKAIAEAKEEAKAKKVNVAALGDEGSGSEEEEEEEEEQEEQEQEQESESTSQAQTSTQPETPKKVPLRKSVMAKSMLDILRAALPTIYSNKTYSTKCQKADSRQPLVISPETKTDLLKYISSRKTELDAELLKPHTEAEKKDIELNLRELDIHKLTLDNGADYQSKFFFCPLTWDYMAESPGWDVHFPRLKEAIDSGNYYHPRLEKWRGGTKNTWDKQYGTAKHDKALDKLGSDPPHSWFLSFLKDQGDPKDETCLACCFKKRDNKRRTECLSSGKVITKGSTSATQSYVLSEKHHILDKDRYARISEKLDAIFNRNDPKDPKLTGYKVNAGSISPGFDYYLRKGVAPGNRFLNSINEIVPKQKNIIEHLIEFMESRDDGGITIFKSLKRGALYHLFLPTVDSPVEEEQLIEDLKDSDIPLRRFIKYMRSRKDDIDEDFLWDLVSLPGVLSPEGLNIVICDVQTTGKRGKAVSTGAVKCPVGFEPSVLYDIARKTLVLYKYGTTYEIICKVAANDKRNIETHRLFAEGHPLIDEMFNYVKSQCHPVENIVAKQELQKHILNVSRTPDFMDKIFLSDAEPINMMRALQLLQEVHSDEEIEGYMPTQQVIDAYSKVTHLIMEPTEDLTGTTYTRWIPIHPSGITLTMDLQVRNIKDLQEHELPTLYGYIHDCLFLSKFQNFVGYTPYAFLLDPGEDLMDPSDDIVIGVILDNGLITFTQQVPVGDLGEDDMLLTVSHPNKGLGLADEVFNIKTLLFTNSRRTEQWYADYREADLALTELDTHEADMRKIYSVRSSFEHEAYQRLRYELTKLLALKDNSMFKEAIYAVLMLVDNGATTIAEGRKAIYDQVKELLLDRVTTDPPVSHLDKIGAIKGFDDLTLEELKEKFTYIRPFVRYECFNEDIAGYHEKDLHCSKGRVFIPNINIVTGEVNNYDNYLHRIAEELLRIPLKRYEMLNDEMDNFVSNVYVRDDTEHFIDTADDVELFEEIKRMYETGVDYKELMQSHYDVANPAEYYAHDMEGSNNIAAQLNVCHGTYMYLPHYWIEKLHTLRWKIYDVEGPYDCIYNDISTIIARRNEQHKIDDWGYIDVREDIASLIGNSEIFSSHEDRQGWELARDLYASMWPSVYKHIKTREQLLDTIRRSERHHISHLDLSLISRKHNIRFIILSKPVQKYNPRGFSCLGTTQTNPDSVLPITYMILYHNGLTNFSIVKDTGQSPAKSYFSESELPDVILKEWINICIDDGAARQDVANHLFQQAPRAVISASGHIKYENKRGDVITSLSSGKLRPSLKGKIKAKARPKTTITKVDEDTEPSELSEPSEPSEPSVPSELSEPSEPAKARPSLKGKIKARPKTTVVAIAEPSEPSEPSELSEPTKSRPSLKGKLKARPKTTSSTPETSQPTEKPVIKKLTIKKRPVESESQPNIGDNIRARQTIRKAGKKLTVKVLDPEAKARLRAALKLAEKK